MNWDSLHDKLIHAAREHPPADQVPYAFEKRVMAHLRAQTPSTGIWAGIIRALWWSAGACTAIAISISVWSSVSESPGDEFTQDLEETILASVLDSSADIEADIEPLW